MNKVSKEIEKAWLARAKEQGLKPGSLKYKRSELEFFVGAMAALNAALPNEDPSRMSSAVPVSWFIDAMRGDPIAKEDA